nr:hypothetical protein B0A51_16642 [Rachicladosporium sp. CCFEE 5018]
MPLFILGQAFHEGLASVPLLPSLLKVVPWLVVLYVLKIYFSGATNKSEAKLHGKVVLVTGGTSGVGEAVVRELATAGAQIVLLTQHALNDPFLVDHIDDLRNDTNNHLITAEQVELASLHSVRTFATKWIDNSPPRRLDMIVLCANTMTASKGIKSTVEGVELNWQVNYLANFHLLSILSPALRAQPPDRDVRVIFGTCSSYLGGDLLHITSKGYAAAKAKKAPSATVEKSPTTFSPGNAYATSKLALTVFALAFQKHLSAYERPDKMPSTTHVVLVDPGYCRTPGMRRWLTWGSLFGLAVYLITYPFWWLVLKSPNMGAQSFLHAVMDSDYGRGEGGKLLKECKARTYLRKEVEDEAVQKQLWDYSEQMVQEAEKRGALERAKLKRDEKEKVEEVEAEAELRDYKEKVGKKAGVKQEGSRRSRKS